MTDPKYDRRITIDQKINQWMEKRDQLEEEYSRIIRRPYMEAFKQEGLVSAASSFLALQYLAHRHFLDFDVKSIYIVSASIVLGFVMGLVCGSERGYSLRETERMKELRDWINHHNDVLQSMRTAPERYDPEARYGGIVRK